MNDLDLKIKNLNILVESCTFETKKHKRWVKACKEKKIKRRAIELYLDLKTKLKQYKQELNNLLQYKELLETTNND